MGRSSPSKPDKQFHTWIHDTRAILASPFEAAKHLGMAQEFAKVDVEHVTGGAQHDIIIMAITDAKYVGCNTASSTRVDEVLRSLER